MVAQRYNFLKARALEKRARTQILLAGLFFIILGLFWAGCAPKVVRVPVPPEDIVRANQAANEGDSAFERKEIYAALIKYLEAVRLNPNSEYLYNRLGIAYSQLKFYSEATSAFRRSIALNPKYPYPYNNLGSIYFAQQSYRKSEKYFKKAISVKQDEASFHMNLGSIYLERKKPEKALEEWRKSLALDPEIFNRRSAASLSSSSNSLMDRYYFLARLFARNGNAESAIENLKLAITNGFTDISMLEKERDFDPLREDERFLEFLKNAALLIKLQSDTGLPKSQPAVK
ncbi:MAG: tetratricopeptide repeat protein [Acidobacteriota bacterium]|jgi:tetratricopeptide (TPR) repeat protein|nr:tetratricopeptide repeat protein [Acidobacteriota bacterium]